MFFCPFCGTLLLIEPHRPVNRFACSSCSYVTPIHSAQPLTVNHSFLPFNKVVEDGTATTQNKSAGGDEGGSAEGGQIITVRCQNDENPCDSDKAYYVQIQMRSADEPATTFFKCLKCQFQWRAHPAKEQEKSKEKFFLPDSRKIRDETMLAVKFLVKLYEMPPEEGQISAIDTYANTIFTGTDKGILLKFVVEGAVAPDVGRNEWVRSPGKNGKLDNDCKSDSHDWSLSNEQGTNSNSDAHDTHVPQSQFTQQRSASSLEPNAPPAESDRIYTTLAHRLPLSPSRIERVQHSRTHDLLFVLCGHRLLVLNSSNFSIVQTISENVGTFFVSDSQQQSTYRSGLHVICASEFNGRGLSVFEFDATQGKRTRAVLAQELVLPEPAQVMVTYGSIVCIGMRREYSLLSLSDGNSYSVLPLGGGRQPLVAPGDGEVFMRYSQSLFSVSMRSMPSGRVLGRTVQLEDEVLSFVVRHPFLFAFTAHYCDVCSLYDDDVTERLPLPGCLFGSQMGRGDFLYAASPTKIWMAGLYSLRHQLADLVERFKIREAFHLLESKRKSNAMDLQGIELELHIMAGFAYLHHCRPKEAMLHFSDRIDPRDLLLNLPEGIPPLCNEYSPELCALLADAKDNKDARSCLDNYCASPPLSNTGGRKERKEREEEEEEEEGMEQDTHDELTNDEEATGAKEEVNQKGYWARWEGPCPYNTYAGELHRAWLETYETFPLVPVAVSVSMNGNTNENMNIGLTSSPVLRQVPEWGPVSAAAFLELSWELFKDELILYFRSRLSHAEEPHARAMEYALLVLSLEMQDHRTAHRIVSYGTALSVEDCYDLLCALREYRLLACLLHRRGYTTAARDLAASRVYVSGYLPPHDGDAMRPPAYERLPDVLHTSLDQIFLSSSCNTHSLSRHPSPAFSSVDSVALPSTCEAMYLVSRLNLHALQELLRESPEVAWVIDEEGNSLLHVLLSLLTIVADEDVASGRVNAFLNLVLSGMTVLLDAGVDVAVVNAAGLTCLDVAALAADGVFVDVVAAVLIADADLRNAVTTAMEHDEGFASANA